MAQKKFAGPLSIHAAMGFGRSYGQECRFLEKKISGIFSCGIWKAIEQQKKIQTTAFVTDIGNDLAYEVPVDRVAKWVDECVDRLQSHDARVVITDLPLDVLRRVSEARYRVVRVLLFPNCRLEWGEMLRRAEQLSERLKQIADVRQTPLFAGDSAWYGWDPIHPRRANLARLWSELFGIVSSTESGTASHNKSLALTWYLRGLRPEKWSAFSFSRGATQPHGRLIDGSEISLF